MREYACLKFDQTRERAGLQRSVLVWQDLNIGDVATATEATRHWGLKELV